MEEKEGDKHRNRTEIPITEKEQSALAKKLNQRRAAGTKQRRKKSIVIAKKRSSTRAKEA